MPTRLERDMTRWNARTALLQARKRAAHLTIDDPTMRHEAEALLEEAEFDYEVGMYASALETAVEVHELMDNFAH